MTDRKTIRGRLYCPGCGLYYAVHGRHREDCTVDGDVTPAEALANIVNILGIEGVR